MTIASGQHEWLNNYAYGASATTPSCNDAGDDDADSRTSTRSGSRRTGPVAPRCRVSTSRCTRRASATTRPSRSCPTRSVVNSTWQSWDAMNPSDGVWYSSRNVGSGVFNCGPFSCSASWSQIVASYPSAKVVYGLGPNLGTGGTFTGNIDNFTVGLSGTTTIYDFEPDCTTTCYVDAATGNDNNTGLSGDPLATIQAGVNKVRRAAPCRSPTARTSRTSWSTSPSTSRIRQLDRRGAGRVEPELWWCRRRFAVRGRQQRVPRAGRQRHDRPPERRR